MFLKKLFYASASILMLALAYHLGASTATAQAPSNPAVGITSQNGNVLWVITSNGDCYQGNSAGNDWVRKPNCFTGAVPTSVQSESFGALKARYR